MSSHALSLGTIITAAGKSQRMGQPKLLLPLGDKPLILGLCERLLKIEDLDTVIVVTGHYQEEIGAALRHLPRLTLVHNSGYEVGGMFSSIQLAIRALPDSCDAAFVLPGDIPLVEATTFALLQEAFDAETAPIIVPNYKGRRGHPILIARRLFDTILAAGAEATLKTVMEPYLLQRKEVEVADAGVLLDIDTPEDYQQALLLHAQQKGRPL